MFAHFALLGEDAVAQARMCAAKGSQGLSEI